MPSTIEDIFNKNAALKGTKLLPHYPAAVANDDRLDEKLPRAPDRQVRVVGDSGLFNLIALAQVAPTFTPEPFQIPDGYAPSGSLTGKMQRGSIPRGGATPSLPTVQPGSPVPPDAPASVSDYFSSDDDIADPPRSSRQAPPVKPTADRAPRATQPEPPTSPAMPSTEPPAPVRPRAKRAAKLPADTPSPTRQARADTPLTPDAPPCGPGSLPPLAPPPADRAPHHADRDNGFAKRVT